MYTRIYTVMILEIYFTSKHIYDFRFRHYSGFQSNNCLFARHFHSTTSLCKYYCIIPFERDNDPRGENMKFIHITSLC